MKESILIGLALFIVILIGLYFFMPEQVNHSQNVILEKGKEDKQPVLTEVNKTNSKINNFSCSLNVISRANNGIPIHLGGRLYYEKPKKFLLELDSVFGPELRVGSNEKTFWFWSKRMKNPGLYWATYDNFHKTRLKTPFNPFWLSSCLGLNEISGTVESGDRWRVLKQDTNSKMEPITLATYVNKNHKIVGQGIYDQFKNLVASSEITEFQNDLPSKITFLWHEENASVTWKLSDQKINDAIPISKWIMPNIVPKIDMSLD